MPPKKRKGSPKKVPSPEGVVISATTRRPGEGTIEANELAQLPGPVPRALAGNPAEGYPTRGPGWERRHQNVMESFVLAGQLPVSILLPTPAPAFSDKVCEEGSPPRLVVLAGNMTLHRPQYRHRTTRARYRIRFALFRNGGNSPATSGANRLGAGCMRVNLRTLGVKVDIGGAVVPATRTGFIS